MILNSFLLGNLLSLCMKIINSVVVVGLYYGFLTTFSIGPSYLFLLRARVMEEGTEKEVSATTGFITGQLMMFISIYYAPLHLALGRPHTITVLVLPYLLFHFFWNNHKNFFDYGSTTRNSMRNLSIQCVFLNNLIFQLFNHFILPSPTLARLVNIYMFRCNNKMLFVTSSFVGWLIGHILFMKWVGLVLFWIRQNRSIRSNKYFVSELRNSMARIRIFSILLFITCVYYLGRIPSPIVTKKLKETSKTEERGESEEETDVEIETTSETKGTKQEQEGSTEEDPSPSLCSEEKDDPDKIDETEEIRVNGKEKTKDEFHFKETCYKNSPVSENYYLDGNQENSKLEIEIKEKKKVTDLFRFWFEKPLVILLFDYKRWNRPLRYIKNDRFENAVRNEMSQYFFFTCISNGNKRIAFTYPPGLSTFFEMIQKKLFLCTTEKISPEELYNHWVYTNEQKRNNLSNEFLNRIEALGKGFLDLDVLEKRTRLCNDETEQKCLPKMYDPFLNGPRRGTIQNSLFTSIEDSITTFWINKFHGILDTDFREFESEFAREPMPNLNFKVLSPFAEQKKIDSENQSKNFFNASTTYPNDQTIIEESLEINEIKKKVPRWSYKLTDDFKDQEIENDEESRLDRGIRSRKAKRVVIFTDNKKNQNTPTTTENTSTTENISTTENSSNQNKSDELNLTRYSQQSDFRRDLIKGSMRAQRRKTVTCELFQATVHSPLFFDRVDKTFFFDISGMLNLSFKNWKGKGTEFKISNSEETKEKKKEEKRQENERIRISETWDTLLFAQAIRGYMLVTQSILRKFLVLPSLIITKNFGRILLCQFPEWQEDFKAWSKEIHVKCTYNGVQLSEKEFPKNWLTDGIQIKILFPFCLKPWHRSKVQFNHRDPMKKKGKTENFCFLTVWGMEAELPFGSPRKRPSFFEPVWKEIEKKLIKVKKKCFLALRILKERTKFFIKVSKEKTRWIIKLFRFIKIIMKKLAKVSKIPLFGLREIDESSTNKKKIIYINKISNQIIHESPIRIRSTDWINYSLIAKKIKDVADRTSIIRNQIEKIAKDKKNIFLIPNRDISSNEKSCDDKGLESPKIIGQIVKRKSNRLIRKWYYFMKFFIERVYIESLLCIITSIRINVKFILDSKNKNFLKSSSKTNQKEIDETNPNKIHFFSTIKKSLFNKKNSHSFCDLASLPQAYVFYKLSQTKIFNKYHLRSVLQYRGTLLFLKDRIKDSFGTQGIFHSESRHKKLHNFRMNKWKNWLRGHYHYQYDFSHTRWSRLVPQKWRKRVHQSYMVQTKNLTNFYLYENEKDQLIHYEKQKNSNYAVDSLLNQKDQFKNYKYDCLSHKYINYEDKKDSYISRSPLQVNGEKEFLYTYNTCNYNTYNPKLFYLPGDISLNNYLREDYDTDRNPDRKYFDWKIFLFCIRTKIDIECWTDMDIEANINKKTKTRNNFYQIIEKIDKKDFFYLAIHKQINPSNQTKTYFDWMEMNEEIINCPISNLELWFFPEFVSPYGAYKIQPWTIPMNLLLFHFNENNNVSEKQKIHRKEKKDLPILSNQENSLELENQNQEEKKKPVQENFGSDTQKQGNPGSDPSKQQKDVKKNVKEDSDRGSDIQKRKKKKKSTSNSNIAAELDFFLKRYFLFQLRWDNPLNKKIINNVKVYCLLLRLKNPKEIAIASIQRDEMSLDVMPISKTLTLSKLIKRGIFIIEPARLSIKWDRQFLMYQTIAISRVQKNKNQTQTNRRCQEKRHVDMNGLEKSIARHEKLVGTRDKNHYDLLVLDNILSPKRRRELRIRICLNSGNFNIVDRNPVFCNGNGNSASKYVTFLNEGGHLDIDINKFLNLKLFLWPNYRLEDLACMNRYWFDTNNGSRFSMSRIHLYPRLIIS
uniref:hypothetical chloroplast RF1 n=1 Tax=Gymnospermium darwasicum TaxID=1899307 RepID=UPI0021AC20AB|nr:hypothetical chloroplast RF1 [Gymnospermium darwasicum]UUC03137.1 hypothetical chloroplast RF1 [Gymnospermium darwasicum]